MKRKVIGIILAVGVFAALVGALAYGIIQGDALICVLTAIPLCLVAIWFVQRGYHDKGMFELGDGSFWALICFGVALFWVFIIFISVRTRADTSDSLKEIFVSILVGLVTGIALILGCTFVLLPLIVGCISCFRDSWIVGYALDSSYPSHRKSALLSIRKQPRLKSIAHDERMYEDVRLMAAERLENQEDTQAIYLKMAMENSSLTALERLRDQRLTEQVARSSSSEKVRSAACLKIGGHFLDSECHCSVCGGEFHDWQYLSTTKTDSEAAFEKPVHRTLIGTCTKCQAQLFKVRNKTPCSSSWYYCNGEGTLCHDDYYSTQEPLFCKLPCAGNFMCYTDSYDYQIRRHQEIGNPCVRK